VKIDLEDFERLLSVSLSSEAVKFVGNNNFLYRYAEDDERQRAIIRIVEFLLSEKRKSGPEYQEIWEKGWQENLDDFTKSGNLSDLLPKFVRKNSMTRFGGRFIVPEDPNFETNFVTVLRDTLFRANFADARSIWEFGCGTGLNLVHLASIFPEKELYGSDWAESSVQILEKLKSEFGLNLEGFRFDLFQPDLRFVERVPPDSMMFTIGAMEQLGENHKAFLDFVLLAKFKRVVHLETIYEAYDATTELGFLAKKYIEKRNWLRGYFSLLKEYEGRGALRILDHRKTFGSFFHDGYTITVWENPHV